MSAKQGLIMGISWGIAAVALIGLLVFAATRADSVDKTDKVVNANTNAAPTQQQPTPSETGDISKISPVGKDDHVQGDKNAKVTLIEYSDFQCPFCSRHVPTLDKILADYQGKVRLVFRNFPLTSLHPYAQKAAEAAECAGDQNKFWEMHDKLFANQDALTVDNLKQYAKDLGLDSSKFDSCLDSGKYVERISTQATEAQAAGITGTPGTFVGSTLVKGAYPYDTFKQIIDSLLK